VCNKDLVKVGREGRGEGERKRCKKGRKEKERNGSQLLILPFFFSF
jgi:hypothetical protein